MSDDKTKPTEPNLDELFSLVAEPQDEKPKAKEVQKLPLYLVFAFNRTKEPRGGGWNDLVFTWDKFSLCLLTAHKHYKNQDVTGVQIVNRFSGAVRFELYKK